MLPGQPLHRALGAPAVNWIQAILATPVVLWGGKPFFERGWASLRTRHLNMFTLIALGTGVAYAYSVAATLFPGLVPRHASATHGGAVAVYFEAAAVITVLVLLGQVLELRARSRTGQRHPGAARPGAEDGAPAARRRRRRGRGARAGAYRATACACGRARRSRSTAW